MLFSDTNKTKIPKSNKSRGSCAKEIPDTRELISWDNWIASGETVRGSGRQADGKTCTVCFGTGIMPSGDEKRPWCGCIHCSNNAEKFCVE